MENLQLALRKAEGVLKMIQYGNTLGFEMCNMEATEDKMAEIIDLIKKEIKKEEL